jgi:hypothetical protein
MLSIGRFSSENRCISADLAKISILSTHGPVTSSLQVWIWVFRIGISLSAWSLKIILEQVFYVIKLDFNK